MTGNQEQKWKDMTLKALEVELRRLPEVEVPETLKAKLFAKAPNSKTKGIREHQLQWRPGVWGLGIAAATVLILALIFVPNYGPSVPSQALTADLDDNSTRYVLADQNNALIADTNYVNCKVNNGESK